MAVLSGQRQLYYNIIMHSASEGSAELHIMTAARSALIVKPCAALHLSHNIQGDAECTCLAAAGPLSKWTREMSFRSDAHLQEYMRVQHHPECHVRFAQCHKRMPDNYLTR